MSFWKSIGKGIVSIFGSGGKTGEKLTEMADEAFHTDQEKVETDQQDLANARETDKPSNGNNLFDSVVDGYNRIPRPAFATWAFGELVGWWNVDISKISVEKMSLIVLIVTFYFAGRVFLKELPSIILAMRAKK